MRWENLRRSENNERRRGGGGKGVAMGGGLGAILMAAIAIFFLKQDPSAVISQMGQGQGPQGEAKPLTPEQEKVDDFVRSIQGSTEDVWSRLLPKYGIEYRAPSLIIYDGSTPMRSGGHADARMGPFYVPSEETMYIDTTFFKQMDTDLGGGGDFAYAYVVAHEAAHHIQKLTGATTKVHGSRGQVPDIEYNQLSVRLELQADFYARVWAHHANKDHRAKHGTNLLEEGDIEEAINSAKAIGDDALQRKATGRTQPETFNHGTSQQHLNWFIRGIKTGDPQEGDTFSIPYSQL